MSRNNNNIIPIDNIDDDSRRNKKVAKRKWNFVKGAFKNLSTGTSLFSSNGKTDRDFDVSSDHDDDDDDDDGCRGGGGGVVGSSVVACTAAATSGGGDGDNRSDGAVTSNDSNILRQAVSWKALGGNDPVDEVASASSTEPQQQPEHEPDPENPVVTLAGTEIERDRQTTVKAQSKPKKKKKKTTTTKKPKSAKGKTKKKKKHRNIGQEDDGHDTTEEEEKPMSSKKSKSNEATKHKKKKKKKTTAGESSKSISSKSTTKTKPSSSNTKKKSKNVVVKKSSSLARLAPSNSSLLEDAKSDVVDTTNDIDDPDVLSFCKSLGLKRSTTVKTLCCARHPNQVITTSDLLEWEQYEVVDVCKICSSEHQALNSLVEELDPVDGSSVPPITYFRRNQIHQRKSMAVCIQQIQDLQKDKELWKKRYVLASTIDEDDEDDDDEVDFSSMIDEMYGSGGSSDFRSSIQEEVETDVGEVDWLNQLGERVLQVQQWSYDEALKDQSSSEYDKYYKMISVGVPLQAVKTTITQDGLDPDGLSEELLKPSGLFRRGSDDENDNDVGVIVDRLHKTFHRRKAMHLLTAANILAKEQKKVSQKQQQRKGGVIRTKGKKKNGKNADEDEDDDEDNKKPGSWWKLQSEVADEGFIGSSDRCMPSPSDLSDVTVQELRNELEQKDNIIQSLQERIASLERQISDWEGGGYTPVSTTAASTDSSDVDDEIHISDRLLVAHQPKPSDDSVDRVSLTEEELFDDIPIQPDDKPLLAAALKAKEERWSKSFSHFDLSTHEKDNTTDMTDDLSNSVPQHLLSMNQPKLARSSSFDTASLDEDEVFEQPKTSGTKPSLLAAALKAKSEKDTPEHLRDVNQPTRSTSFESASLDEDDLFEDRSAEDAKSKKPLLAAALKAKAEGNVPDHLKDLNQPTATRSLESHSLDSDELFEDTPIDSKLVSKPLLAAALKAKADEETPVHLRNIHQPQRTRSIDSLSLDNEEIFEEPPSTQPSAKPLLEAAQKAKLEQSERSEVIITLDSLSYESDEYEEVEEVCVPEHLLSLNQPKHVLPEDGSSLDDDDLFDTQVGPPSSDRPLLSAALKAREQHEKGIENPSNPTARDDSNGHTTQYDGVPAHLLTAHQPTIDYSYEEYSIDEDELFDEPSDQPTSPKPLLAAALKARKSYTKARDKAKDDESGEESKGEQMRDDDDAFNEGEGFEYEEYEISIVEADTSQETTGYNAQAVNSSDDYTEVTVED
mmetsp:Transcript_58948/g.144203  ORF Transcript_58948/g.144203 Transcript_58948/m.144203 type:complete len:1237 (+) Transcript_58948:518-4228(+)